MIALACDHAGYELKPYVIEVLKELNLTYKDFGVNGPDSVDYPVYGARAANSVASGECDRGIVLCGTGVGIALAANKVRGIRCAVCSECFTACMSRLHNNANMLALGARVVGGGLAKSIVRTWLTTDFEGDRHARRVGQISMLEDGRPLE
ncbi:MAG: ribose 5-phosphate isomerase B [Clostridia bacterium]|nr:ribose 5-phosphate isomerase B [Clostridia bacterium]